MLSELIDRGLKAFRRNSVTGRATGTIHDEAMRVEIALRKQAGNPTHVLTCDDCRHWHDVYAESDKKLRAEIDNWAAKHPDHNRWLSSVPLWDRSGAWKHNADVKEALQATQTMVVTNLHSLANSATAGWSSASVDNSANLYLDSSVMVHLAAVNTAPGSDQTFYIFAYGSQDGSIFTSTGTSGGTVGTEGALTFPSISTLRILMPQLGQVAYPVQNKALDGGPFMVKNALGYLPRAWGVAALNFTGFTLASSGNTVTYAGLYNTVI